MVAFMSNTGSRVLAINRTEIRASRECPRGAALKGAVASTKCPLPEGRSEGRSAPIHQEETYCMFSAPRNDNRHTSVEIVHGWAGSYRAAITFCTIHKKVE